MAQAAHVQVVADVLHQLQYQLRLVQGRHVRPRLLPYLSGQLAAVRRQRQEGGRAVDGGDQRLGQAALLELVRRHLSYRRGPARSGLGAGDESKIRQDKFFSTNFDLFIGLSNGHRSLKFVCITIEDINQFVHHCLIS